MADYPLPSAGAETDPVAGPALAIETAARTAADLAEAAARSAAVAAEATARAQDVDDEMTRAMAAELAEQQAREAADQAEAAARAAEDFDLGAAITAEAGACAAAVSAEQAARIAAVADLDARTDALEAALAATAAGTEMIVTPTQQGDTASSVVRPLMVAPFPLKIVQASLLQIGTQNGSVTDNWIMALVRGRWNAATPGNDFTTIARKSTWPGSPDPPGENLTGNKPWTFDAVPFADVPLQAGDSLWLNQLRTGAATALSNTRHWTLRFEAL